MRFLYTFFIITFSAIGYSQTTPRNILQKKYDLASVRNALLSRKDWKPYPQTPDEWKAKVPDSIIRQCIIAGEAFLNKPFESIPATVALEYVRTGNRTHYQDYTFKKRNQLWSLVLAESMEGKGRFTDDIINGIWSISEETFWGLPAHLSLQKKGYGLPDVEDPVVDLFAAETAGIFAMTDYLAGSAVDKVSPLARRRITAEVERRVFKPLLASNYGYLGAGNPDRVLNNWAPWVMSNFLCATYFLEHNADKRASNTLFAMKYIDQYINGLGDDGGCDEGPAYWFAAGGAVFDCLNFLDDASGGKISVYNDPFIGKIGSYIYKVHIDGNYFINNSDAPSKIDPDGLFIYRFGKAVNDERMMAFGAWDLRKDNYDFKFPSRKFTGLYNLLALDDCRNYKVPYNDQEDVWFRDLELMSSRSKNGLFVATHGGHNAESHNHNDVGDFTVYADGEPVVIDVGAGAYTARTFSKERYKLWFNTSPFHNLPTINNTEQSAGRNFKATNVSYSSNKTQSSLTMDIASAYPNESGLKSWIRKVEMVKKGSIRINDHFSSAEPVQSLTQTFMTICPTDITKTGKVLFTLTTGKKIELDYDPKFWIASIEQIELKTEEDQNFKAWGKPIWRILLTAQPNLTAGNITYTFHK